MPKNRFFVDSQIDRLTKEDIPALGVDWIDIKSKLNQKDQEEMQQHQIEIEMVATSRAEARRIQKAGKAPMQTSYRSATSFLLSLAIVDWSFIDTDTDSKIPITLENIHQLDPRLAESLNEEIDARNPMSWESEKSQVLSNTDKLLKVKQSLSQNAPSVT